MLVFIVFTFSCTLGEASNPGPIPGDLLIGAANPNGLLGKGHVVPKLPRAAQNIWAISETHHTKDGANKIATELKLKQANLRTQFGHPVQAKSRNITAIGGKHSGVGFISDRPSRHLAATWTSATSEPKLEGTDLSRVHAACFQCGGRQVHGGVTYGHAHHSHTASTQVLTDMLCQAMHNRIVLNARGLRFIAGDLNQDHDSLPSMIQWADMGWVNVQKWAFDTLGKPIQPTCQGRNVRDHIFVSPELAPYLLDVDVQEDWFSDLAILFATFTSLGSPPMIPMWRVPQKLPWKDIPDLPSPPEASDASVQTGNSNDLPPNERYQHIWDQLESRVIAAAPPKLVSAAQLGRATTYEVTLVQEYTSTPKLGRHGDLQPQVHHPDLCHTQKLRQLRRLISWERLVQVTPRTATQQEHLLGTWSKIRAAPGFAPDFVTWWNLQNFEVPWPTNEVSVAQATKLVEVYTKHFRSWENSLLLSRVRTAKQRRVDDPNVIFRDLKAPPPKPVQMLLDRHLSRVVAVDETDQAIEVEPPGSWDEHSQVVVGNQTCNIIHAEKDKLWIDRPVQPFLGAAVKQECAIGTLPEIFLRFRNEWNQRWEKHVGWDDSAWNEVLAFADLALPKIPPMEYAPISYDVPTNFTVVGKFTQLAALWSRLGRSLSPYATKVRAVKTKAWTACLHAVGSVHIGSQHFQQMRTGCVQALGLHKPGFSPMVHMSLAEAPELDPQCFALLTTVTQFRMHHNDPGRVAFVMDCLTQPSKVSKPQPGPCSVLLTRLHSVGWGWDRQQGFHDAYGLPCDLLGAPIQEVSQRLKRAWQQHAQSLASQRKKMQGLALALPQLTMAKIRQRPPEAQAILKSALNGTFFTADHKKHVRPEDADSPSDRCVHCGQVDSQIHRHWFCPQFASDRPFTPEQLQEVQAFPLSFLAHGWMPEPPSLQPFRQQCLSIPDEHREFCQPRACPEVLHFFTDGGCEAPTSPYARLAYWGTVLADIDNDCTYPIANGLVSGWLQTALRGEITGVASALAFAIDKGKPIVLWVDNDVVVRRVRILARPNARLKPNQKDSDLWGQVLGYLQQLGTNFRGIVKVVSHQDISHAQSELEEWVFRNNGYADKVAYQALDRHSSILRKSRQLQQEIAHVHVLREQVHTMFLDIGKKAIQAKPARQSTDTAVAQPNVPQCFQDWTTFRIPEFQAGEVPPRYQCDSMRPILDFMTSLGNSESRVRIVSWYQLAYHFELATGSKGVTYDRRTKKWYSTPRTTTRDITTRANAWGKYLRGLLNHFGFDCCPRHVRSDSAVITFWCYCIPVRISHLSSLRDRLATAKEFRAAVG
eukprot:Skav205923  [mRNA]  locus=scaffold123:881526:886386:+ [translate_table: standard]